MEIHKEREKNSNKLYQNHMPTETPGVYLYLGHNAEWPSLVVPAFFPHLFNTVYKYRIIKIIVITGEDCSMGAIIYPNIL